MKQCSHGIDGLRSGSSSFSLTASKSEHEDAIWGDYTLDLSFLSSDDQRSGLDDDDSLSNLSRDVETTTKEGQLLEGNVELNPSPLLLKLPEILIKPPKVPGDDEKLELSCAKTSVLSEKSNTDSDQDDSEVDSPCWRGIHSHKALGSGAKSATSRRSTDDLSGFHRLNPLAPQFVPSSSKKNIDKDGKKSEEQSSSSLKKSLSSNFPSSSSGEFNLADPPEERRDDAARRTSILTHTADGNFGVVSPDSVSKTVNLSDSRNELQPSKRLDPLAPLFVPSSAKLSPSVHEKQGAFETNTHSTSALAYSDNKSLDKVKVDTCSAEVDRSIKIQYSDGVHVSGSTSSYNPWFDSKVKITEYAKPGSSNNKSHGQRRLNPLAPQFSLAGTQPKAYIYENYQSADDLSLVVNTAGLSPSTGYGNHNVVDADLAQSSAYAERLLPNMSRGSSLLISPQANSNFGSNNWFAAEPKTAFSVKGDKDFKHPVPFHVVEAAASSSSSDVKALSDSSPSMDVKKLLTTMHGLSELLTLAHGSECSNSPNAEEIGIIKSTVHNLNMYIKKSNQERARSQSVARHNSYDLALLPNKSKLSIKDLQLPRASNMTVDLDVKRKEKYSMVSGEMVPDSSLFEYGATKDNSFGQVVAKSGYLQNHQGEEEINQHALFYKSLWLKAEAERCLMVYETSLSNQTS